MSKPDQQSADNSDDLQRLAESKPTSLLGEFWLFLRENKKWWLLPLLLTLAVYVLFLIVSVTNGPAFIYTLF